MKRQEEDYSLTADGDFHGGRDGHVRVEVGRQCDVTGRFVQMDQIRAVTRHHPVMQLQKYKTKIRPFY